MAFQNHSKRAAHPPHRNRLIAKLHVLKGQMGLDDGDYRDMLETQFGKRSSTALSIAELETVVKRLGDATQTAPRMTGPYAPKLRALWLSAWNLGVVRNRSDDALVAFVKRQTGLEAVRWLRDAGAAAKAIEALKSWMVREAGVNWAAHPHNPRAAVVDAQWRALCTMGVIKELAFGGGLDGQLTKYGEAVTAKTSRATYTEEDWDAIIAALGKKLRFELAKSPKT